MQSATMQRIEGNWDQFKGKVKETWGDVTDDDLAKVEGQLEQLVGVIKERTGERREEIERRLDQLAQRV